MDKIISPYIFHPEQVKYAKKVEEIARNGGMILIEAGSGFGKTIANIIGALRGLSDEEGKVLYLCRTEQQGHQVIEEIRKINEFNPTSQISCLQMASRRRFCKVPKVRDADPDIAWKLCRECQNKRNSMIKNEFEFCCPLPNSVTYNERVISIKDMNNWSDIGNSCGYLTARELFQNRKIIACNYFYFLSPEVRETIGLVNIKNSIVIFDEGHNLENASCDVYKDYVDKAAIIQAKKELEIAEKKRILVDTPLLKIFKELEKKYDELRKISQIDYNKLSFNFWNDFFTKLDIDGKKASFLQKAIEDSEKQIREAWLNERNESFIGGLATHRVWKLYKDLLNNPKDFFTYLDKNYNLPRIIFQCLNPQLIFGNAISNVPKAIICSATLAPMQLETKILGIKNAECVQFGGIAKPENVLVLNCGSSLSGKEISLKFNFVKDNNWVIEEYAKSLKTFTEGVQGGSLIFFPSHYLLNEVFDSINELNPNYSIFKESTDTIESMQILENYEKEVKKCGQAVLMGVFRGRFAEGADLPDELSRAVIICGIPYAKLGDPFIIAKKAYYSQQTENIWQEWYDMNAYRLVAQALGRGWRNQNDYAVGILLDSRYQTKKFINFLPYWLRTRTDSVKSFENLMKRSYEFLNNKKEIIIKEPRVEISKKPRVRLRNQPQICPICKGEILNEEDLEICPGCKTQFHQAHLLEWVKVKGTCPVCRVDLIID